MSDDNLFESTETFEDQEADAQEQSEPELTADELAEQHFEVGVNKALGIDPDETREQEPAKTLIAGMTEDELKAALSKAAQYDDLNDRLRKTHDTAFGKIGQLEQTIRELKSAKAEVQKPVFTKDSFKKLAEYFDDENIAESLAEDLSSVQFTGASAPQINLDEIYSGFEERLDQFKKEAEIKSLTDRHPTWREDYHSEEFSHWKSTLMPEHQEIINTSWDSSTLSKAFSQFNNWKAKKAEALNAKNKRLEDAIPIKGGAGSGRQTTDDDPFMRGMKRALANK